MRASRSEVVETSMLQRTRRACRASLLSGEELATSLWQYPFKALELIRQLSVPLVQRTSSQKSRRAMTCLAGAWAV